MSFCDTSLLVSIFDFDELSFGMDKLRESVERHLLESAHQAGYCDETMPLYKDTLRDIDEQMEIDADMLARSGSALPKIRKMLAEAYALRAPLTEKMEALRQEHHAANAGKSLLMEIPRSWLDDAEAIANLAHHAGNLVILDRPVKDNAANDFDELNYAGEQERNLLALTRTLRTPRPVAVKEMDAFFTMLDKLANAAAESFEKDHRVFAELCAHSIPLRDAVDDGLTDLRRIPALPLSVMHGKLKETLTRIDAEAEHLHALVDAQDATPLAVQASLHMENFADFRRQCKRPMAELRPQVERSPVR